MEGEASREKRRRASTSAICATSTASPRRDPSRASDSRTRSSSSDNAEIHFNTSCVVMLSYIMDFRDAQRWRVTTSIRKKRFRSLPERKSTTVDSSTCAETLSAQTQALFFNLLENTVKTKVSSIQFSLLSPGRVTQSKDRRTRLAVRGRAGTSCYPKSPPAACLRVIPRASRRNPIPRLARPLWCDGREGAGSAEDPPFPVRRRASRSAIPRNSRARGQLASPQNDLET